MCVWAAPTYCSIFHYLKKICHNRPDMTPKNFESREGSHFTDVCNAKLVVSQKGGKVANVLHT